MLLKPTLSFDVPGVYLSEDSFGAIPQGLADHNTVYMVGFSTKVNAPVGVPTFVQSVDDFFNIFGASASINSVKLFFAQRSGSGLSLTQRSGSGLYFVNVAPKVTNTLSIASVTAGTAYTLTISGYPVSHTAVVGDTPASVLESIRERINATLTHVARMTGNTVRTSTGVSVAVSAGISTVTGVAPAYPVAQDVVDTINAAFDPDMRQGFLIAPEFAQNFTLAAEHQTLAMGMEGFVSDPAFNWVALIDCRQLTATQTTGAGAINLALAERSNLSSPKGHLSYFFPYWRNGSGDLVPLSASVAGIALRRYKAEGFRQPPAGVKYPVYGVTDTSIPVSHLLQSQLNPVGINCARKLPMGRGTVIYGSRTLSNDPLYKFLTTRVIMNVWGRTLLQALDRLPFSSVDGLGVLFLSIKQTVTDICERLRQAGALYGSTPEEAYLVICDDSNNPALDLENGSVSVDAIGKISPILESAHIRYSNTSLGTNLSEIASSGDTSEVLALGTDAPATNAP